MTFWCPGWASNTADFYDIVYNNVIHFQSSCTLERELQNLRRTTACESMECLCIPPQTSVDALQLTAEAHIHCMQYILGEHLKIAPNALSYVEWWKRFKSLAAHAHGYLHIFRLKRTNKWLRRSVCSCLFLDVKVHIGEHVSAIVDIWTFIRIVLLTEFWL